jgi:putative SOS response-associated peptidase YedK
VAPGTRPLVLHRLDDGAKHADWLFWGYCPPWFARGTVTNACIDTLLGRGTFWRRLFEHGRVIVPADGWYEWTGKKPQKQPWFIQARNQRPCLIAGITAWRPSEEHSKHNGMALVTDDSAGGMVDIGDRRPVVLAADDALDWMDPATTIEEAKEILLAPRPESAFEWYPVTPAVSNAQYQLPDACQPIAL